MSKDVIEQKVMKMLRLIGLEGYENKDVTLLSGAAAAGRDRKSVGERAKCSAFG